MKKTSFFLVKTVEKIDIFDQLQAKMNFQDLKNSLPFFFDFNEENIFWIFLWEKSRKKSKKIIKIANSKTPFKSVKNQY